MAKNIDFMGAVFPDVPSVKLPQQGGGLVAFDDTTDATATADKILSGYTAYANGQKLTGTASGGITPSGTMSITSNGIYDIVSFASVDVNVSGGGGGITADDVAMRTISGVVSGSASRILASAFWSCSGITAASFPNVTSIGSNAFAGCRTMSQLYCPNLQSTGASPFTECYALESVDFPYLNNGTNSMFAKLSSLKTAYLSGFSANMNGAFFSGCTNLVDVALPVASMIGMSAFAWCSKLSQITLPQVGLISASAFYSCKSLMTLNLLSTSVATLSNYNAFVNTPMSKSAYTGSFGSIYVPASLVDSYKSAPNWSYYSDRITSYVE